MKGFEVAGRRKQAKITQAELAISLGWNTETIVDIERGRCGIDDITFDKVMTTIQALQKRKEEVMAA